jgi:hypothetical protein
MCVLVDVNDSIVGREDGKTRRADQETAPRQM